MTDEEQNGPRRKVSRSAKLPQHGFEAIRPVVQALADLAAPSTKERIAEQLGIEAKGRFLGKLAAAGYYGFIERTGESRLRMTSLGEAFLGGGDGRTEAMRKGLMRTNFGPIIHLLRSQEPKQSVIAARLQDDVGIPAESAGAVAKTLIAVSREAQLIGDNGKFSASAIEDTHSALESAGELPDEAPPPAAPEPKTAATPRREQTDRGKQARNGSGDNGDAGDRSGDSGGKPGPLAQAPPVQVVVNIDASALSAQQIAELIHALRTPPTTS